MGGPPRAQRADCKPPAPGGTADGMARGALESEASDLIGKTLREFWGRRLTLPFQVKFCMRLKNLTLSGKQASKNTLSFSVHSFLIGWLLEFSVMLV
jgi:hypothetical protein